MYVRPRVGAALPPSTVVGLAAGGSSGTWGSRLLFSTASQEQQPTAVVLSGCGVYDGSDVHEAVAVLHSLSKRGAAYRVFAPDRPAMHTVNHVSGEESGEPRNVLEEAARIARGAIWPLSDIVVEDHSSIIFPGGFGAAKNLSTFAVDGAGFTVHEDVANVLHNFQTLAKPIGMCCIAPVLGAKILYGAEVTIGNDVGTAEAIASMGARHHNRAVDDVCIDEAKKLITTPAYMYKHASVAEVFSGIDKMVKEVLRRV